MFDWALGGLGSLFGFVGGVASDVVGWAWDKVTAGIFTWLAQGLALVIEWVWSVLDSSTTPRVTADWFANGLAVQVGLLALSVTVAMMLASAMQAALAGRPEQIVDATRQGVWAIVASALTVTVIDVLIRIVDEASAAVWQTGRSDMVSMLEGMVAVVTSTGPLGSTFVGPLLLLIGFLGLLGLTVSLMMRNALIYVAAALAPLVFSANILPAFRGSARKLVHLATALIISKLAICLTLVLAVKLIANPGGDPNSASPINDAGAAVGQLMTGFTCFIIAAVTPVVLYKLMPTIEGAAASTGIAGSWTRTAVAAAHTAVMVKSLGVSAATRKPAARQRSTRPGSIAGLTGHEADAGNSAGGDSAESSSTGGDTAAAPRAASPRRTTVNRNGPGARSPGHAGPSPGAVWRTNSAGGPRRERPGRPRRTTVPRRERDETVDGGSDE